MSYSALYVFFKKLPAMISNEFLFRKLMPPLNTLASVHFMLSNAARYCIPNVPGHRGCNSLQCMSSERWQMTSLIAILLDYLFKYFILYKLCYKVLYFSLFSLSDPWFSQTFKQLLRLYYFQTLFICFGGFQARDRHSTAGEPHVALCHSYISYKFQTFYYLLSFWLFTQSSANVFVEYGSFGSKALVTWFRLFGWLYNSNAQIQIR